MKKTHLQYLDRGVGIAINLRASDTILDAMARMKGGNIPVYGLIRDIVSDVRFYSVTESDSFWRKYSVNHIRKFIEGLSSDQWANIQVLTGVKEDFLNEWFANHLFFLSEEEKKERLDKIEQEEKEDKESQTEDCESGDSQGELKNGGQNTDNSAISDCTDSNNGISDHHLPEDVKEYAERQKQKPNHGLGKAPEHTAEAIFLKNIDPSIVQLAELIGRSGRTDTEEIKGEFLHSSKSDITGITVGNNLNCVMPSEMALLGDRSTENVFYHRYSQKRLQVFASASSSTKKPIEDRGPIFMCIDTSGSMCGDPEKMAKTLALAVAIVAQRRNRSLVLVNYSHRVSFFVLTNLKKQKMKLLSFLSKSYDGGNDENLLFSFLFKELPQREEYRKFSHNFEGADLLIISDFSWCNIHKKVNKLLQENRDKGMRIYGVSTEESVSLYPHKDYYDEYNYNGYDFFNHCDFKYLYTKHNELENITNYKFKSNIEYDNENEA